MLEINKKNVYTNFMSVYNCIKRNRRFSGKFEFINRSNNAENLLYILAGYKANLWERVFGIIKRETPSNFDVCILSSGKYVSELDSICKKNGWSYIYSRDNLISNIQNYAIENFPCAKTIWKMDEDMFLCERFFSIMKETREKAQKEIDYDIGFVAPLIPINSYGYIRFLKYMNKFNEYEQRFGEAKIGSGQRDTSSFLWSIEAQKFLWEVTGNIKDTQKRFDDGKLKYSLCSGRFSIGAIMFSRELWIEMNGFERDRYKCDGNDEITINTYCLSESRAIVVAEDALVCHYAFGWAYDDMDNFINSNRLTFFGEDI